MHFLAIARVDWMRLGLVAVPCIGALIVDLHHHTCSHGAPVGGIRVALGRDVPALAAACADAGDYFAGFAVDGIAAEVVAAGIGEVVRSREADAMMACC